MKSLFLIIASSAAFKTHAYDISHSIVKIQNDHQIVLEDGSIWEVSEEEKGKLEKFSLSKLSFRAEESWFNSGIKCYFVNLETKEKLNVSLVSQPNSYDVNSHWVAYLEPKKSILFLDNGAIFSLYDNDREYFKNWLADDFVILGDYSSWLSQSKHILFNYRTKEYIFGELHN